ncbi:MAG: hypothetical protein IJA00_00450 [Bacteroidaceae bacterium]|nr:hypothetical protein [Bacteroidaceae bacterium]
MLKENIEKGRRSNLQKVIWIMVLDCLSVMIAYGAGLWIRFEFSFELVRPEYVDAYLNWIGIWCAVNVLVFFCLGLYNSIWSFVSTSEVFRISAAYGVLGVILAVTYHFYGIILPRSSTVIGFILSFIATGVIRFSYRMTRALRGILVHKDSKLKKNVMVIGAGDAGRSLVNEFINSSYIHDQVVCIIDDNPVKINKHLTEEKQVSSSGSRTVDMTMTQITRTSDALSVKRSELIRIMRLMKNRRTSGDLSTQMHYDDVVLRIQTALGLQK